MIVEHIHIETKKDLVETILSLAYTIQIAEQYHEGSSGLFNKSFLLLINLIGELDKNISDQDGKLENRFIRKEDAVKEFKVHSSLYGVKP